MKNLNFRALVPLILILLIGASGPGCGSSSSSGPSAPSPDPTPENGNSNGEGDDDDHEDEPEEPSSISVELDFEHLYELAEFPVGMAVSAGNEGRSILRSGDRGDQERAVTEQHFNQLTAGNIMKMSYLHNEWGVYTYDNADQLVDYAHDNGMSMHGHALVWHSCYQVPSWVGQTAAASEHDGDTEVFLDMLAEHTRTIASYYAGRVESWDVVNEAFTDAGDYRTGTTNCWNDGEASVFYEYAGGPEYIETAFIAAREGDPNADLYYNDFNLTPNGDKLAAVLEMVDDFQDRNIPIDGIGFQMHTHLRWPSIDDIRASFQHAVDRDLKVKVTELDIPINNYWGGDYPEFESFTEEAAEDQRQRYCEIVEAYLDVVPENLRGGITVWGLVDGDSWLISLYDGDESWPLLFNDDLTPKPAIMGVADALRGRDC